MASITKEQAEALAENFLDDIGAGSVDDLQPRETLSAIFQLAGELIEAAQENLNKSRTNASGNLSSSIQAQEPTAAPGFIQIDIEMLFYGQFVNKGVRGKKSGSGLYAFKSDMPGEKMVDAIQKYMKDARAKISNVKKPIGYEKKNKSIAERASAFAMARAIKQHGIKATYFMDNAIDYINSIAEQRIADALGVDILNSLPDKLN